MSLSQDDLVRFFETLSPPALDGFVGQLRDRLGLTPPPALVGPTVSTVPVGEPALVDIHLLDAGANKILLIKLMRELKGLGLKEAKDLVESTPVLVFDALEPAEASRLQQKLQEAGARVELR